MEYYGNNDWRDYHLSHHGILGMKWGIRNGPPYPLGSGLSVSTSSRVKDLKKQQFVNNLSKELNEKWEYGVLTKNGRFTDENDGLENFDWEKDYKTIPLPKMKKEKIGVCWDFVNYQHDQLKKAGIKDSSYLIVLDLSSNGKKRIVTHTFTTYELAGKQYWLESAMWPKRGIHEIKNYKQAAREIAEQYTKESKPYSLFRYKPEGLDKGLTDTEFFDRATDGTWIGDFNVRRH